MNLIGLNQKKADILIDRLNHLLSEYSVFYMNTRGFHWNIQGDQFFELHEKFEELYDSLAEKVDEIAERILTLGGRPVHTYSAYIKMATIKELTDVDSAKETVKHILDALHLLIVMQRDILNEASEAHDEGTADLMSDYVKEQEKLTWMYNAYLK